MSAVNDRVEQIRARLESSGVTFQYQPATMRHDIVFLLAERDELLRRVEQAEVRTQKREQKAYETGQRDGAAAERHGRTEEVEQAERAGAVRALEPGRWWRAVDPDGGVWCESSDEAEVRASAHPDHRVQRLWTSTSSDWRDANGAPL